MAKRHEDFETGVRNAGLVDRIQISSDIANGLSYITIYNRKSTWRKGNEINFFRIRGQPYLRIDENKVNQDYLGDIPELEIPLKSESGATAEQIARLEQLEKQITELKSPTSKEEPKPAKISRGSLPKENSAELPQ